MKCMQKYEMRVEMWYREIWNFEIWFENVKFSEIRFENVKFSEIRFEMWNLTAKTKILWVFWVTDPSDTVATRIEQTCMDRYWSFVYKTNNHNLFLNDFFSIRNYQ